MQLVVEILNEEFRNEDMCEDKSREETKVSSQLIPVKPSCL